MAGLLQSAFGATSSVPGAVRTCDLTARLLIVGGGLEIGSNLPHARVDGAGTEVK